MHLIIAVLMFLSLTTTVFGQKDSSALLKEAGVKLQTGDVSSVLTDNRFVPLHASTHFREMISQRATANLLRITVPGEPGKKIRITATVRNKEGKPIADALVYLYQTDSRGWYSADAPHVLSNEGDFHHARLFGYVCTDKNGYFAMETIKPAGYPQSDLPAHVHVHVWAEGYKEYNTEFLFQDDERLKGEILNRAIIDAGMIGIPEAAEAPLAQKFSYQIKLVKN